MSRIRSVRNNLVGTEDADDIMLELMDVLGGTVTPVPDVGNFYIFVYNPKTPGIRYDQNPLVAVTDIFQWGFRGINFHWGETRQYTWNEIVGQLYQVLDDELDDLDAIPFSKILINN
tara:strand:- start:2077 stop:2427 length:351 start_codon:yes stop_codon:yes gene_type:complete